LRLCTFRPNTGGPARLGAERDATIVDLRAVDASLPATMIELLALGSSGFEQARAAMDAASDQHRAPRERVRLLPPVTNPAKIICIGLNYRDHAPR